MNLRGTMAIASMLLSSAGASASVDAPELAGLGPHAVGVRTLQLRQPQQPDPLDVDPVTGIVPLRDRDLSVDIWYPAHPMPDAQRVVYTASLPAEPPAPPTAFSVHGMAVRDAPAEGTRLPWVLISHGYSNDPAAMTWITENLASKGYVVAAIHHDDPPITDRSKFAGPLLRRPLDIAFVADTLRRRLSAERLVDPERLALIGYSMGGYGVLTAAGARLDADAPAMHMVPAKLLESYAGDDARARSLRVASVRAVVAISPAGGGTLAAWGPEGLKGVTAPMLLISGDADHTVNYLAGAHAMFASAINAPRYLLTFKGAGHALGLGPVPEEMRGRLWDQDWFEDPVWRKDRVMAINAHFITAFLDRYLKGDESRAAYLELDPVDSDAGTWTPAATESYAAYSPGGQGITLWKGFQRNHAAGLEFRFSDAKK